MCFVCKDHQTARLFPSERERAKIHANYPLFCMDKLQPEQQQCIFGEADWLLIWVADLRVSKGGLTHTAERGERGAYESC